MTDYITVQPIGSGYRVLAHRDDKTACQVCITPHKRVALDVARDLQTVIKLAIYEADIICVASPYITIRHIRAGYCVFAYLSKRSVHPIHITPHRAVAHGIKADLEAVIKRAVEDALTVRQLELL